MNKKLLQAKMKIYGDTNATLAALHIWSAASIAAVSPLVSTIPNASCAISASS